MELISNSRAVQWCANAGIRLGENASAWAPDFPPTWRLKVPGMATDAVNVAYVLLMTDVPDYAESNFQGGLLWLRRWELWSESVDRVGYELLSGLLRQRESSWLDDMCAVQFSSGEFVEAHACVSVTLMFQWDAYFVPATASHVARLSHEGWLELALAPQLEPETAARFKRWGLERASAP